MHSLPVAVRSSGHMKPKQDGGGYYASGWKHLTTSTYALVSEGLDIGTSGPDALFRSGRLGTIRVSATGTRAHPISVGIARKSQVASYLGSVSHDAITDFEVDPLAVTYARRAGHTTPSAPGRQTFWTARASGSGRETMTWPVAKGDWAIVVMNADGARGGTPTSASRPRSRSCSSSASACWSGAGLLLRARSPRSPPAGGARPEVEAHRVRSILPLRRPEWSRMATPYAAPLVVADAPQPPRLSVLRAVAAAGLATAGCALGLALANDDVSGLQIALLEWISIPYIAAGLVAWWRRPDSRLGVLMIAGGFASALSALAFAGYALPHTIGLVFDILPAVIFLHVYLAFPDGRLRSPFERSLVGAAYASAIGLQLLKMALGGVGPNNVLEVSIRPDAAQTVESIQLVSISVICLVGIGVLARRRRRAGRPLRRPVALLIDSFALGLLMIAVLFVSGAFGGPAFVTIQRAHAARDRHPAHRLPDRTARRAPRALVGRRAVRRAARGSVADRSPGRARPCPPRPLADARLLAARVRDLGRSRGTAGAAARAAERTVDDARRPRRRAHGGAPARPRAGG